MANLDYDQFKNLTPNVGNGSIEIGGQQFGFNEQLDFNERGAVFAGQIANSINHYQQFSNNSFKPQLAALLFISSGNPFALDFYFPLTNQLNSSDHQNFYLLVREIIGQANFVLEVIGPNRNDATNQIFYDVPYLVAGHIAQTFFGRTDILYQFLSGPRHFKLYSDGNAFAQDGGAAGGDYNPSTQAIQLVMSRLYEGYNDKTPGVAPLLHEFGHMLDFYDVRTGRMDMSAGLLPGWSEDDGPLFTPQARQAFLRGKYIEMQRYENFQKGTARQGDPVPIGHPYVFQNDTEFIAGYFEMFYRNPNYMAQMNQEIYTGFAELLRQDSRKSLTQDFAGYVTDNQKAYIVGGQRPNPHHLTIPNR